MTSTKRLLWERRVCDWASLVALAAWFLLNVLGFSPGRSLPRLLGLLIGFAIGSTVAWLFLKWDASIRRRVKAHPLYFLVLLQDEFGS